MTIFFFPLLRWTMRVFLVLALFFIALHHPDVRKWAMENTILRPTAERLLNFSKKIELSRNSKSTTLKMDRASKKQTQIMKEDTQPKTLPSSRIRATSVALPAIDHLSKEDQDLLIRELEHIEKSTPSVADNDAITGSR